LITSIQLENFKSFEFANVNIGALTLMTGVNGSGKSTILQSIAVLRQSLEANGLNGEEGLLLNGEYLSLGVGRDVLYEHAESRDIGITIIKKNQSYGWKFEYAETSDMLRALQGPDLDTLRAPLFTANVQYLRADRVAPAVVFPKSYSHAVRKRFLGVQGQYAAHFLAHYQDELVSEKRRREISVGAGLLDQVGAWLSEISPGVVIGSKEVNGADLAQLWYRFGGRAGLASSNEYRPTNVAFGLTYVLPVIVGCLSAQPGDLLLIENPEAHLHPRGQSLMGELLSVTASNGVQIICESHSEHVLNGIRLAVKRQLIQPAEVKIHFCEASPNGRGSILQSPVISADGRLSDWPVLFFDEWERALMELI
jgi:predicted ATPase